MTTSSRRERGPLSEDLEHYFTAHPASAAERRELSVRLAGRDLPVEVASGVFSGDGLDRGTAVLLGKAPDPPPNGTFLDLGCGWGPIALTLALLSPAAQVYAVDVNERALDLLRRNATRHALGGITVCAPDGIPPDVRFDLIWSNPPIRIGKAALHELLQRWLPRLAPQGQAYLVVAKHLGAQSLQDWIASTWPELSVTRVAMDKGFRIIRVARIS